jgi:hypothetical protein
MRTSTKEPSWETEIGCRERIAIAGMEPPKHTLEVVASDAVVRGDQMNLRDWEGVW